MASSKPSGIAKMIVQYEWILENVEKEPKTFATKMILFRGEKVFRVGLKNHVESPVLFFMAIDLNKMGMKVGGVIYGIKDSGISPAIMTQMKKGGYDENLENLQLFTTTLAEMVTGNRTFVFRICIEGSDYNYSYQLSDRLAKEQLWAAATNKNGVDVEFVVKGKTFYAHKNILAARSKVFAAEFTKEQPVKDASGHQMEPSFKKRKRNNDPLHQIHIDDVEPATVEQFLHFVYTGESMGTLANEELLKLATEYELSTLARLCRTALEKIEPMQMVNLLKNVNKNAEVLSTNIRPEKETEIFFDRLTTTFQCFDWFQGNEYEKSKCLVKYQNEEIFFAYVTGERKKNYINDPVIHCSCAQNRSFGLTVEDIYFGITYGLDPVNCWYKMESKNLQKKAELLYFTAQPKGFNHHIASTVNFDIKVVSTVGNYYYEMMDVEWMKNFWFAATNQILTDVGIFVGAVKVLEAHQIILSARSPVLYASLSKITNTGKSIVTFGAEFDVEIVKHFLKFLYTGSLETSASHKQLQILATMYEVETLKNMCQLTNRAPPDVEEFTNSLLGL